MPKIALIGAGSTVFAKNLIGDILSFPELADSTIALMDIDPERLRTSEIVAHRVAATLGAKPTITATLDRRRALDNADYVINMIQVGGARSAYPDFEIPKKYGLRQTIADTVGVGGIIRGLRTIPVLLDMCRDMEELCPDVFFLNYVNPMAMNCWAISRASQINTVVGLCHSVQGTAKQLARAIGVPYDEIDYLCAGINHMAFYLRFMRGGEDLYPSVRQVIADGRVPNTDRVRYEVFKYLGYFVTESSEHFAEYVPWFIKRDRPDLLEQFNLPLDEYLRRCEEQVTRWEQMRLSYEGGGPIEVKRSHEYASFIIDSIETGQPRTFYGNVSNQAPSPVGDVSDGGRVGGNLLIDNLPRDCCVEVPCVVDENGWHPQTVGTLPPHLAALMQTNINVQSLTVEAALTGKREHVYHAAMLDPHTAAELSLDQIAALVDELLEAHGEWIPDFKF